MLEGLVLDRRLGEVLRTKKRDNSSERGIAWPLLAGLALVALLAAASCGGSAGGQGVTDTSGSQGATESQAGADLGHPSRGETSAPVVLVEYADYQ